MKLKKRHIDFLKELTNQFPFFKINKPFEELLAKEPIFLSDYVAMIYRRRPLDWNIQNLEHNFPFFEGYILSDDVIKKVESKSKKIYKKYFPKDKMQNHQLDLMRRLLASRCCEIYNKCDGLPEANFDIGGCEGLVSCPVYNLGGSHGQVGYELRDLGYTHRLDVPKKLRLEEMNKFYKLHRKKGK